LNANQNFEFAVIVWRKIGKTVNLHDEQCMIEQVTACLMSARPVGRLLAGLLAGL